MPYAEELRKQLSAVLTNPEHANLRAARCSSDTAREIVTRTRGVFVRGTPRSWWYSPQFPHETHQYPSGDGVEHLLKHVPSAGDLYWLILETEDDEQPVFGVTPTQARQLLRALPFVEYYLVNSELNWLLIENDHNEVLVFRAPERNQQEHEG